MTILDAEEAPSKRHLEAAYHDRLQSALREHAFQCSDGRDFRLEYAHSGELLRLTLEASGSLQQCYEDALARHPCDADNPWHMVVMFDEVCPGNKLKAINSRKSMNFIYNFMELGANVLPIAATWLLPVTVRSQELKRVIGGWSHVLAQILRFIFMGPENFISGVAVEIRGRVRVIYAKLHHMVTDGDGFRMAMCWMGANGVRCCLMHNNVVKKGHHSVAEPQFVDICCDDNHRFCPMSSHDFNVSAELVRAANEQYQARGMTLALFKQIQTSEGLKFNERGLPWDAEVMSLNVFNAVHVDWVHSALHDGTFNTEIELYLPAAGVTNAQLDDFFHEEWVVPTHMRGSFSRTTMRSLYAHTDDPSFKKVAISQMLGCYSLVRYFVETRVELDAEELRPQRDSFLACCAVIDCFLQMKRDLRYSRATLDKASAAISRHMQLHKAAYGTDHIKPKHHWLFDVIEKLLRDLAALTEAEDCLERWKELLVLVDCFLVERFHLTTKQPMNNTCDTRRYERSVLAGTLNKQVLALKTCPMLAKGGLLGTAWRRLEGFPHARVSNHMQLLGKHVSRGDFCMLGNAAMMVVACIEDQGELYVAGDECRYLERISEHAATYKLLGVTRVWRMELIKLVAAWKVAGDFVEIIEP